MKIGRPVERRRFVNQFAAFPEPDRADRGDMDEAVDTGPEAGLDESAHSLKVHSHQPAEIPSPIGDKAGQMDDMGLSSRRFKNSLFVGDVPI